MSSDLAIFLGRNQAVSLHLERSPPPLFLVAQLAQRRMSKQRDARRADAEPKLLSISNAVTWVWNAALTSAASQTLGLRFVCLPNQQPLSSRPPILPGCEAWFLFIFRLQEPLEDSALTTKTPVIPRSQIRIAINRQFGKLDLLRSCGSSVSNCGSRTNPGAF